MTDQVATPDTPDRRQDIVGLRDDGLWQIDVDTYLPKPEGFIKVGGVEYPIYNFMDLRIEDSIRVARLGDDINNAESYDDRMKRSVEQLLLLNEPSTRDGRPRLVEGMFDGKDKMPPRAIIATVALASGMAKVKTGGEAPVADPQTAGPGAASDSRSSSPESAGSTGGPNRTSST